MNNSVSPQNVYIDTSALRGMSFYRDVARLLALSKAGTVRLYISETTLWERGRQQYEGDEDRFIPFTDKLNRYLTCFKAIFEKYGVIIIPSDDKIVAQAALHIQNDNTYFKQDDEHDQRDAHVLATAELKLAKDTVILCNDSNLANTFETIAGFPKVRRDFKDFIIEVMGEETKVAALEAPSLDTLDDYQISTTFSDSFQKFISKADYRSLEYLKALPTVTDKLSAKLANMQVLDAEIRKRILGYAQWFSPVGKQDLQQLLAPRRYGEDQIESNAQRLKHEKLLIETENYWLTNTKDAEAQEICDQAMAVVMPEILEIMELS